MFELSVASKYLTPRWRQLSVSIISLISILVIALVVWLVIVFFSVTHGLEKSWMEKLTALTAPVRITPTEEYYNSYYYQIDGLSSASNYTTKSLSEKLNSSNLDPFNPEIDGELPSQLIPPLSLQDIVKETYTILKNIPESSELIVNDYELTSANIRIYASGGDFLRTLSQSSYLGTFEPNNLSLNKSLIEPLQKKENLLILPKEGVLLPKSFKEAGVKKGDRGHLIYYAPTLSSIQEQQLPIFVAGFYDPGIFPIGGKFVLANKHIINLIRTSQQQEEGLYSNGFNLRFQNLDDADFIKNTVLTQLKKSGLDRYWTIETFREFDFTKDLAQQLRSERNLWTLIATVILIVACSNIISMLIILVNDKKTEIGILRSMGASSFNITLIFGICGMIMGALGSIIGSAAAIITLKNLQSLISFIGRIQGFDMFNPIFYGNSLPNELSAHALLFVIITTSTLSLLAGIVPAIKACLLRPSQILRSE